MLPLPETLSEKYDADKEQVDAAGDPWRKDDLRPGIFHLSAPMNVVEYEDGILAGMLHAL